jgi:hypothetical protein
MNQAINNMVAGRVHTDTGVVEQLNTARTERASTDANVQAPPSIEDLSDQMRGHQAAIDAANAELAAVVYNRNTGAVDGPKVTGQARERLEASIAQRTAELNYTAQLLMQTSAARVEWNKARAAQAAQSPDGTGRSDADAAVRRERSIDQLANTRVGGKLLGREAATAMFDKAAAEEFARKLARGEG